MGRRARPREDLDTELADLPSELRWREWMGRVEAVIFASPEPVGRDALRGRPYELVAVAGGWRHQTKKGFADAIRAATGREETKPLSRSESLVLMCVAYFQPITRGELGQFFGKEVSRDTIGHLRGLGFIAAGPRSPQSGAPYSYVTTKAFLGHFGFDSLRDLPDIEALEDAGLLKKQKLLAGDFPLGELASIDDDDMA